MVMKINNKQAIKILAVVLLVLLLVVGYVFVVSPSIKKAKVGVYQQGVVDFVSWVENQIQTTGQATIDLQDRQIICQYR